MRKQFFIEKSKKILKECDQIRAKNESDREKFLAQQSDFQKRFADTRSSIQTVREAIQKTMQ